MAFFPDIKLPAFGLDIGDRSLKVVKLEKKGKKIFLKSFGRAEVPEGYFEKGRPKEFGKIAGLIRTLIRNVHGSKIKTSYVISVLPETKAYITRVEVPRLPNKEMAKAIKEEIKYQIPLSFEEALLDWQELPGTPDSPVGGEKQKLLIAVAQTKIVEDYLQILHQANLTPLALEVESAAIARALNAKTQKKAKTQKEEEGKKGERKREEGEEKGEKGEKGREEKGKKVANAKVQKEQKRKGGFSDSEKFSDLAFAGTQVYVDIGATRSSIIFAREGIIQFTASLPFAGRDIDKIVAQKLKLTVSEAEKTKIKCGLDPEKCRQSLREILEPSVGDLIRKIKEALTYYSDHFQAGGGLNILLCGGGSDMLTLDSLLSKELGLEVKKANPLVNISLPKKLLDFQNKALIYITAIGLALRGEMED